MVRAILLSALLLSASSVSAGFVECEPDFVGIEPLRPTTDDVIRLHVRGGCPHSCHPHNPRVEVTAGVVHVRFVGAAGGCLTVPSGYGERVEIGRLPAGTHEIVLSWEMGELARKSVTVTAPPIRVQPRFGTAGTSVRLTVHAMDWEPTQVTFGGAPATFQFDGIGSVVAVVPEHAPGLLDVVITTPSRTITAPQTFDYTATPDPSYFTKVLFPVTYTGPGAFGSLWKTDNWIFNRGSFPIFTDLGNERIAGATRVRMPSHDVNRGLVVGIPADLIERAWFASNARDLSRSLSDAGTELRVPTEDDTRSAVLITGIAIDSKSRYLLRVYDIDSVERTVFVGIRGGAGASVSVDLRTQIRCVTAPCITHEPAFAMVDLGPILAPLQTTEADIEIRAFTNDARVWGFITATNNETQHVTTYTPQR